ncbi:MAG TPA: YtxH domain-containing protein [Terriglobia bacterium]|nr:YtxH domain-containing protein [Terriglobia bacterium]
MDKRLAAGLFLAGAMAGVGVALLCAPQSGARTRRDIGRFARKTADQLDDLQGNIREQVTDCIEDLTEVVKDGVNRGKTLGSEGYEKVLLAFDNAKTCVEDGKSRVERLMGRGTA